MSGGGDVDLREQGNALGLIFGLVCGFVGYAVNDWPGAISGAIAGYGAGRLLVFIVHTVGQLLKLGAILALLVLLFAWRVEDIIAIGSKPAPEDEAVAADAPAASTEPMSVWFKNSCSRAVRLYLRWDKPEEGPTVLGYWDFDAGKGDFLLQGSDRIAATSPDIYFYAVTLDDDLVWRGSYPEFFNGRSLPMRKADVAVDPGVSYDFAIDCVDE